MPVPVFPIFRSVPGVAKELRTLCSLTLALEGFDPFNNSVARFHWRLMRSARGW